MWHILAFVGSRTLNLFKIGSIFDLKQQAFELLSFGYFLYQTSSKTGLDLFQNPQNLGYGKLKYLFHQVPFHLWWDLPFSILTLKKYVDHTRIAPLCLPANPNQYYNNVTRHKTAIYGFGYDIHFKQTIKDIAKMEKAQNKMLPSSRTHTLLKTKILSRKECLEKFGKSGDVLEGKGGPEDMVLKV